MRISTYDDKISPYGGLIFCRELFTKTGLPSLIDKHLGKRGRHVGFNYSEILTNHMAIFLHGGDCTEDINDHLRSNLKEVKGHTVCSADTILRGIKELATPNTHYVSASGVSHEFNINSKLNELLVKALLHTKTIR